MTEGSLTARPTSRAGAKAGHSDPAVACGSAVAQRIKGTPGITGSSCPRVHIDGKVWHLNWGETAEMPSGASAYNGEPLAVTSHVYSGQYRGKSVGTQQSSSALRGYDEISCTAKVVASQASPQFS